MIVAPALKLVNYRRVEDGFSKKADVINYENGTVTDFLIEEFLL